MDPGGEVDASVSDDAMSKGVHTLAEVEAEDDAVLVMLEKMESSSFSSSHCNSGRLRCEQSKKKVRVSEAQEAGGRVLLRVCLQEGTEVRGEELDAP